jgi:hypothetical protein
MEQPPFFADVELPFHVWIREGSRWVLRDRRNAPLMHGASERRAPEKPAAP